MGEQPESTSLTKQPASSQAASSQAASSQAGSNQAVSSHTLKVHHLRPAPGSRTAKTRVGRGEGSKGKSAGRGTKGTSSRYQVSPAFEGGQTPLHMRLPKLRGFKNPFSTVYQVVNLDRISELFPHGGQVGVPELVAVGAVRKGQKVKVLGTGDITVAVQVSAHAFSASAAAKISAAGGSTTQL